MVNKMHKVYENDDLAMFFKKRYCRYCGEVLSLKKTERVVKKGDPDHSEYCCIGTHYHFYGDILVIGKEYYCVKCEKSFSCEKQHEVVEAQKFYKKKIVTDEEIENAYNYNFMREQRNLLKGRWFLLIPYFGGWICIFLIFNTKLKIKTKRYDGLKLIILGCIALLIGGLIAKLLLHLFNGILDLNNLSSLITFIFAMYFYNFPILWYINHKFK